MKKSLALIGGGPAALMICKRLLEAPDTNICLHVFESTDKLGRGMPYSPQGAGMEHVTNVSGDELPDLLIPLAQWIKGLPVAALAQYGIDPAGFHSKQVLPRLLFGNYLNNQFESLISRLQEQGVSVSVHLNASVLDIRHLSDQRLSIKTELSQFEFDYVVICSGHHWPDGKEATVPGFFDSPYPPAKINARFNHTVVVQGSSLTAIDAIRTLARNNGRFVSQDDTLSWLPDVSAPDFRIEMHSRHGLLPGVRVHMEEPHSASHILIEESHIASNRASNDGFLSLDFVFEKGFKEPLKESDGELYQIIKEMNLETFVDSMMRFRENIEPFELLQKEYLEAIDSINRKQPVYWKETLAALSFAMNYPAKYFCAEDMLRLQKTLMPLISVVIAFVPQSSCLELLALHRAGRLELITDRDDAAVEINDKDQIVYHYKNSDGGKQQKICQTFIDCTGQPHLSIEDFPFKSLLSDGSVSPATLEFRSVDVARALIAKGETKVFEDKGKYFLKVAGAAITDHFQLVSCSGQASESIYLMAVPYMGGLNPDYSGLDFCERASELIVGHLNKQNH